MTRKTLTTLAVAFGVLVAVLALTGNLAHAAEAARAAGDEAAEAHRKGFVQSGAVAPLFWLFALMVVGGSIFVITRKNLIAAVMGMVGTFFAIAATYVMLSAQFIAAIQVLVYAGAIMVLFVFVIMILNRPEEHPMARQAKTGQVLAVLASLYLLWRVGAVLWAVTPPADAGNPPPQVQVASGYIDKDGQPVAPKVDAFGSPRAVGSTLFGDYLFPFEAVSLVLLIAVVGAIAVARPHDQKRDEAPGEGSDEESLEPTA